MVYFALKLSPNVPLWDDMWGVGYQMDVGASPVHPESPPMTGGGKG